MAEAKAHLRIASDSEDDLVSGLIQAARGRIEEAAGIAMIARTLCVPMRGWSAGTLETRVFRLPVRPAGELVAEKVYDAGDVAETVMGRFTLEAGRSALLVWSDGRFPWPSLKPAYTCLEIVRHESVSAYAAEVEAREHRLDLAIIARDGPESEARDGLAAVRAALHRAMLEMAGFRCVLLASVFAEVVGRSSKAGAGCGDCGRWWSGCERAIESAAPLGAMR